MQPPPIAIIGAGLRLPGGVVDLQSYWKLLVDGVDAIGEVPEGRWDVHAWPEAPTRGGFLQDIDQFDAAFYGISPREAVDMDPAQRLLLDVAWEALESSGTAPDQLANRPVGVYVGVGLSDYGRRHFLSSDSDRITPYAGTGAFLSVAAGRVAYLLGLTGPAMSLDTACSSSLVALHTAVTALRAGEVESALAGGVNLVLSPVPGLYFHRLGVLANDGRCKTFSAHADGYGRGEGAVMLHLMRLSDALDKGHEPWAVILGSALNHDGRSNGLTAPSARAQTQVIRSALRVANVDADQVGLVEAHGTGTPLGDPIEIAALREVFNARADGRPVWLGSVKANVGHVEAAAGITGLLKAALAIRYATIPPQRNAEPLNPRIRLEGSALRIPTSALDWSDDRRIAGVSSFGLSGTNAHVVLGRAPSMPPFPHDAGPVLFTLSAGDRDAASRTAVAWAEALDDDALADAAFVSQAGRAKLRHGVAVVATTAAEARERLRGDTTTGVARTERRTPAGLAFLFSGQGSQYVGMGAGLRASNESFARAHDQVLDAVDSHLGESLLARIGTEDVHRTRYTQPALFALQVALASWWHERGVEPDAVIGHSVGEIAAAHVAGMLSLDDAAKLVVERGRQMGELPLGGAMAVLFAEASLVGAICERVDGVTIAAVNAPHETVISGEEVAVQAVVERFTTSGIGTRSLQVERAFHSPLMGPALSGLAKVAESLSFHKPDVPMVSTVDSTLTAEVMATPAYWVRQAREPVRFADAVNQAVADDCDGFLEIGPRSVLAELARRNGVRTSCVASLDRAVDEPSALLLAFGRLRLSGIDLDHLGAGRRIAMPPTQRSTERFWVPEVSQEARQTSILRVAWHPTSLAAPHRDLEGPWVVLGDPAIADALVARGATVHSEMVEHAMGVIVAPTGSLAEAIVPLAVHAIRDLPAAAEVWFVTRDAQEPDTAVLRGLWRTLVSEQPLRRGGCIELDAAPDRLLSVLEAGLDDDVIRVGTDRIEVARLLPQDVASASWSPPDGAILITGAFGALGGAMARRLASRGARHLVLASRRGGDHERAAELVRDLEEEGCNVTVRAMDVAEEVALSSLIEDLDEPIVGAVHCAGVTADTALQHLSEAQIETVLRSKVAGTRALHRSLPDLQFLVLFGSIAGWLGNPGQGAYAAANAFLDAFAQWRQRQGLPTTLIAWGPWAGDGLADRVPPSIRREWEASGIQALSPAVGVDVFERCLAAGSGAWVVAPFDWAAFRASRPGVRLVARLAGVSTQEPSPLASAVDVPLDEVVERTVHEVLGRSSTDPLDRSTSFFEVGMDSIMAMELRERLAGHLGVVLPPTLAFDHPTMDALQAFVLEHAHQAQHLRDTRR
ncbi:MAG: type I polyketide synthase [Myxococcota bacterium]